MTEPTNQQRAQRVAEFVKDYYAKYEGDGEDVGTVVQDIISDLLHYNRIIGRITERDIFAAGDLLQSARDRFLEEVEEEEYA